MTQELRIRLGVTEMGNEIARDDWMSMVGGVAWMRMRRNAVVVRATAETGHWVCNSSVVGESVIEKIRPWLRQHAQGMFYLERWEASARVYLMSPRDAVNLRLTWHNDLLEPK